SIVGWSRTEALVLGHHVLWGAVGEDEVWAELDALLRTRWKHPSGGTLGVEAAVIDSGNWTDRVYAFCFPRLGRRVFAGKGQPGTSAPATSTTARRRWRASIRRHARRLSRPPAARNGASVAGSDSVSAVIPAGGHR